MTPPPARIDEVLEFLGIGPELLEALRAEGLFESDMLESDEAEDLRVAASLMRDLGVNPPGVQVVLHLRRRLLVLQERTDTSLRRLLQELEQG